MNYRGHRRDYRFMSPAFWGKAFWDFMFLYARTCSAEKVQECFKTLTWFVPCKACRIHFKTKLRNDPVKEPVFEWIHEYKNEVNKRQREMGLDKPDLKLDAAKSKQNKLDGKTVLRTFYRVLKLTLPKRSPKSPHPYRFSEEHIRRKLARLNACTAHCVHKSALQPTTRHKS